MVLALLAALLAVPAQAGAETRSLKLYYLHTGEKAIITYKKDGKYIPGGMAKINRFLRDWRRNEPTKMDPHLMDLIWEVYKQSGSKDYIHVVSGYRAPATNAMLRKRGHGVAKYSQHMLGKAMDFFLPDVKLSKLREIGLKAGVGGVGFYPTSGSPFVHLDTGNVRHWPRMTRQQLVKVFPHGGTLHIPSDGKPLPGYEAALAAYKARKDTGETALASAETEKKKGGFFGRLFASAKQEQEEDEEANSAPAPRTVRASVTKGDGSELRPAVLTDAPQGQPSREQLESGTPVQIAEDSQANPVEQQLSELAYVPVPEPRPQHSPPGRIPTALIAEKLRSTPAMPSGGSVIAALTADDIEHMRRSAQSAPRPVAEIGSSQSENFPQPVDQTAAREAILAALNAKRPADGETPIPVTSPMTVASITPEPDPRRAAAPRTLELALAATETRPSSADEAIRSLIEADNRLRQGATSFGSGIDVGNIRSTSADDTVPRSTDSKPQPARPSGHQAPSRMVHRNSADWVSTGSTVLAGFQPIERVAYIRAPAYGMGMMRTSPREVLSAGFVQTAFVQPTRHFNAGATAIPIFTRYED
ncbi:MAG: DUF882 domain-containing protein [Salaquimonas sp.]|nr:DUF882 domain-containing protein [Salaquimonas sp.]